MKLKKIKKIPREICWDITVEKNNNFFANDILVHNSNAAIVFDRGGDFYCQSRENIVDEVHDNAGFAHWVNKEGFKIWKNIDLGLDWIDFPDLDKIVVFGEWCGGNVQGGVALNQVPKMFVIFALKFIYNEGTDEEHHTWEEFKGLQNPEINVYTSKMIPAYEVEVDLNYPQKAIDKMNSMVEDIDKECPFCKTLFDVSGVGEGIVFSIKGSNDFNTAFKVKGSSHSKSKVKKLPTVDPVKVENLEKAVELHCDEDRLEQIYGKVVLTEEDKTPKKIGDFIRLLIEDAWEEEGDSIRESDISRKEFGAAVSKKAARWFQNKLQSDL